MAPTADETKRQIEGLRSEVTSILNELESRGRREMHPTVCAECGADTLVPFLPRGDKPVYCSPCFERVRAGIR